MKKPNFEKPKKEAKKHEKESVSLVDELKIDKEENQEDFLEEELEAKFWRDLYQEKLDEIRDDQDFKKAAIKELEQKIKKGTNGDGWNARRALWIISSIKNLEIYKDEFKENLKEIKNSENFKKAVFEDLERDIKSGKNGNDWNAKWTIKTISLIKNLEFYKDEVKENLKKIKNSENFKKAAMKDLEDDIKSGKNGNGGSANWALLIISSMKDLEIYKKLQQYVKERYDLFGPSLERESLNRNRWHIIDNVSPKQIKKNIKN